MIFQSFLLANLVSLCMKIINSVVVVGLYYGFLTTFSIGPSYLFLLRAQVIEEGTENKVSATTGFITGQLMMFISIYYAPLHLALDRPHTITALAIPYLFFNFFWNNHEYFFSFYYGSTTRNSMRNFSIQCVFLNNLIFQLFNHFILPSSMLARLINIYMFRCNNKMLFVISSFVGWLIGQILFMKCLGLVLVWVRQNYYIRLSKYFKSEFLDYLARFFSILLFIICVYYLGRMPSPFFTKKLKETAVQMEEGVESEEEIDVETDSQMKWTKQEQEEFTEEDPLTFWLRDPSTHSFFSEKKADPNKIDETEEIQVNRKEDEFHLRFTETDYKKTEKKDQEKPLINLLFDSKRWNRPFRYINDTNSNGAVRNEMSQYFFNICKNDGKERMSFTYLPSLSVFFEMINRKISSVTLEKSSPNKFSNTSYTNKHFNNEFINRLEALDKKFISLNILKTRTRLCNDDYTKEYLSKRYDPFLNRSYRKTIYKNLSPPILKKTLVENFIEKFWINRIHGILISDTECQEFEEKIDKYDKKPLPTKIFDLLTFISRVVRESGSNNLNCSKVLPLFLKKRIGTKNLKYLLTQIVTDVNDHKIFKKSTRIKEISKKVLRWSYKLLTELELEQQEGDFYGDDYQIRSKKHKSVVIFTANKDYTDPNTDTNDQKDIDNEISLIRFSKKSDFRRALIAGSMRFQRRKIGIFRLYQINAHSPIFLNRINYFFYLFSFNTSGLMKFFRNWTEKGKALKNLEYREKKPKRDEKKEKNKRNERVRKEISKTWKYIPYALVARSFILLTQSIFRKYILLPLLIIVKNIGRMLLLQLPEWSEDFREWDKEVHIKCTYTGVPAPEKKFIMDWLDWLMDGIQIKIVSPFRLKPWNKSKDLMKKQKDDSSFLTVWGKEAEIPFGPPRKQLSFFKPIYTELNKKIGKLKNKYFRVLIVFFEKTKLFQKLSKVNSIFLLFRLKEVKIYESRELKKEKDSLISNQIIHESLSTISSTNWTNSSVTEKKIKDLAIQTNKIINQIQIISKEKKKITQKINNLISANKKNYNNKIFKKWQILNRRNARIICKLLPFLKFYIEKIYTDIFLYSINILKMNTELFLKLKKKKFQKLIYNNEKKQRIIKKKKNVTPFTLKLLNNISKTNSHTFYDLDLSYVSQAYVFYKLSQIQVSNSSNLRYVLHYQEIPFFLKPEIKDSLETRGMIHSKLRDKKLTSYEMNQWKNWLREHYQYNLSQIKWSRLIPEKWRNKVHQHYIVKKEILIKCNSKDLLIDYKKQKEFEIYSKKNFQKNYRYDLLSYKFLNYENKMEYRSSFQEKKNQEFYYTSKETLFYMLRNIPIPINNYLNNNLVRDEIPYMEKTANRKYFDWKILNFYLRQNVDIEASIMIDTKRNRNTQIITNNSQIISKKDLSSLMISEKNPTNSKKDFFDWMRMNEKMLKHPISNLESWFFPEFVLLYNAYKMKPWFIPSKLLLLNLNKNKKEKELTSRGDLGSLLSQQKDIEENYVRSDMEKRINKKQDKAEAYLDLFLDGYFLFQFKSIDTLKESIINNIKLYSLLLRLKYTRKFIISSVQKREINLAIMMIQENLILKEFTKRGILILEPLHLSGKKDRQFIMYQTIGVSLIHKNKYQINQKYQEQRYVSKNHFYEAISTHQRIVKNRYKNGFDLLVPENILSFRQRRKLRILICLNSKNRNDIDRNSVFYKEKSRKNNTQVSHDNKHLNREKNQLIKLKLFLWPNYRLEDLACMNRYWFDTNNGSRFSILRVHLYPQLKI
uniref:Protein TIC 214 n=1 Tax=Cistanche deserticola TaxID=161395 RepID=A0A6G9IG30_CISDE|nr:hypothetical chloroplast RF1 [Cistanche deserticola]QIQ22794.1 hypothetical chloroplast RF1 [Cistanche deserticola]